MPKTMAQAMTAEFEHETRATRRMLEQVPSDKLDWKPHEKSMTLGRLASHIAELPWWAETILDADEFDFGSFDYRPPEVSGTGDLVALLDRNAALFVDKMKDRSDEEMLRRWVLRNGEQVITDTRKVAALRGFVISHTVHHRGQLSVFLRLLDVPVTETYGPTADSRG